MCLFNTSVICSSVKNLPASSLTVYLNRPLSILETQFSAVSPNPSKGNIASPLLTILPTSDVKLSLLLFLSIEMLPLNLSKSSICSGVPTLSIADITSLDADNV